MDEAEILHGDLNIHNFLFDGNQVNFIDFGEGSFFETGDTMDEPYPNFVPKSNLVNFEHNGLSDCIKRWQKMDISPRDTFVRYLCAKGEYYENHAQLLENSGKNGLDEMIDYEKNYAKILKNPDNDIIENELRRIDTLYTFEEADTAVNYDRNPNSASLCWNLTVKKANDFKKNTEDKLSSDLNEDKRKYFEYQNKIATSFVNCFEDWKSGTLNWIQKSLKNPKSEHENAFVQNKDKKAKTPLSIYSLVMENKIT